MYDQTYAAFMRDARHIDLGDSPDRVQPRNQVKANLMSLANGVSYLAIPGPSVMPDRVLREMNRVCSNIYEGDLVDMTFAMLPDLKAVARTKHHVAIYIANGHGTWEASLSNMVNRGDHVLVLATGRFGHGWAEMAQKMGIQADILEFGNSATYDPEVIRDALAKDTQHRYKAVLVTHVDTSSSVKNDVKAVRDIMDDLDHPALLAADCVASMGCDRFEMDDWGVDVAIAASQKGLMVPPGLGFVFFSDKAAERQKQLDVVSPYWDWIPRANPDMFYQLFCGTAPTQHLHGLRVALDMIHEEGIENTWARHSALAKALWAAIDVWGQDGGTLRMNISDPNLRSNAVTSVHIGAPLGTELRQWVEANMGITLGIGLGMSTPEDPNGDGFFRFGHMGHVNGQMMLGVIGSVEAALCALDAPHGRGAVDAAARVLADLA